MKQINFGALFAFVAVCLLVYSIFFNGGNNDEFENYLNAQNQALQNQVDKIIDTLDVVEMRLQMRLENIQRLDSGKTLIKNYYQLRANEVNEIFNDSLLVDRIRKQIQSLRPARFK